MQLKIYTAKQTAVHFTYRKEFKYTYYASYVVTILKNISPILVALRSKAGYYGRSLDGIVVSNPAGGMDVCLLRVLCVVRYGSLRRADHTSIGDLPSVVCLSVIMNPR